MALADQQTGYWKCDEASGAVLDYSGNALTMTSPDPPASAPGKVYALARDYTPALIQRVFIASNPFISRANGQPFTCAFWMKADAFPATMGIVTKDHVDGQREWNCYWNANALHFEIWSSSGAGFQDCSTPYLSTDTEWRFVIVKFTGTHQQIKIDNVLKNTLGHLGTWAGTASFRFGAFGFGSGGTAFFDGRIGPVAFWQRSTTDEEDAEMWNAGAGITFPYSTNFPSALFPDSHLPDSHYPSAEIPRDYPADFPLPTIF